MTKRINLLTAITALSLTGMLILQVYFLYATFHEESEDYVNMVNSQLELVIPKVEEARLKKAIEYHILDIMDTTLIEMTEELSEEGLPLLVFKDPKTGAKHLSYGYTNKETNKAATREEILDRLFNRTIGESRMFFSLTNELDERRDAYMDTVSVDLSLFRDSLNARFQAFGISQDYEFDFVENATEREQKAMYMASSFVKFGDMDKSVSVVFNQPVISILRRIYLTILASLIVVILIAASFFALIKTVRKQRQLSKLKDDFIDGMTHELLTPLATLKIALESLKRTEVRSDASKTDKYLKVSEMELSRVSDIVQNVLYSSLHEQEEAQMKLEEVNVNEVLEELTTYHRERNEEVMELSFQQLENPWVVTDKQHFTSVLHNLVDNAIKYSGKAPAKVVIVPTRFGDELSIVVNDNGRGIAEPEQTKIFDKFYQAADARAAHIKGLGVGLYYVKTILARLNGSVELLESSPNGSSFRVSMSTDKKA